MWSTAERATMISPSPPSIPRLCLRPPGSRGSPRTLLDGGWWPRSADPVAELPGLILALRARAGTDDHGPIAHILLRTADWDSHPRRLLVEGPVDTRVVRLSWFETLPAGLLTAIRADGRRIDLLTVPAGTHRMEARAAMDLAAHPSNHLRTPELLAALREPVGPEEGTGTEAAPESTWETEGGRLGELVATR